MRLCAGSGDAGVVGGLRACVRGMGEPPPPAPFSLDHEQAGTLLELWQRGNQATFMDLARAFGVRSCRHTSTGMLPCGAFLTALHGASRGYWTFRKLWNVVSGHSEAPRMVTPGPG
jgi:hypothetical protein